MKLLVVDTETSPNQVDTWGLRQQNIAINQIRHPGQLLCFGAAWVDRPDDEIIFDSINESPRRRVVQHLHALYSDADVIIGYNNISFDTKVVNREFVLLGLGPPPPFKQVDLLRTMRQNFRLASNKLDFVARELQLGSKIHHMGHALWSLCEEGDEEAWKLMKRYNCQDVLLTKHLYRRLLPWIRKHPNHASYEDAGCLLCPTCGSQNLHRRGFERTVANKYQRYQCRDCGSWMRTAFSENTRQDREKIPRSI